MNKQALKNAAKLSLITLAAFEVIGCLGLLLNKDSSALYVDFRNIAHQAVVIVISLGVGVFSYIRDSKADKKDGSGK